MGGGAAAAHPLPPPPLIRPCQNHFLVVLLTLMRFDCIGGSLLIFINHMNINHTIYLNYTKKIRHDFMYVHTESYIYT